MTKIKIRWLAILVFVIALVARLVIIFGGQITSDDAYILMRVARNIANGLGFVFNSGDRVQAISSFLYGLLSAGIYYLVGDYALLIVKNHGWYI